MPPEEVYFKAIIATIATVGVMAVWLGVLFSFATGVMPFQSLEIVTVCSVASIIIVFSLVQVAEIVGWL